jgi:heme exporter protein D
MAFESFGAFLNMGEHGLYVWLAYGLAALVVLFNLLEPRYLAKQLVKDHQRKLRREQA